MTRILAISSSPSPKTSKTRILIGRFIEAWSETDATMQVIHRDLGSKPPAHLDAETIAAFYTDADKLTATQKKRLSYSDTVIDELEWADVIVIGAPMHNFGIPSALKAWIDQVARVGKTFRYTDKGPVGLLSGKQVIVLGARGGDYSPSSQISALDQQTPYLRTALNFIGLTDTTFIYAEAVARDDAGLAQAETAVRDHVATLATLQAA
ncbi:MAG: NAD(P)H-dependent oxidoreductase [Rhodospirillales bacterium]|nr:NAD(P)H-dependent oxidoreductase [Rhodospirillales bacterium]